MKSKQKSILKSLYAAIIQGRISFYLFFFLYFFASFLVCSVEKVRSPEDAILYCVTGSSLCVFVGSVKKNKQKIKTHDSAVSREISEGCSGWEGGGGRGRFKRLALFPCVLLSTGEEGGRGAEGKVLAKRVRCWKRC